MPPLTADTKATLKTIIGATHNAAKAVRILETEYGIKVSVATAWRLAKDFGIPLTEGNAVKIKNLQDSLNDEVVKEKRRKTMKNLWLSAEFLRRYQRGIRFRNQRHGYKSKTKTTCDTLA